MSNNKFVTRKQYALLINSQAYQDEKSKYPWLEEFFNSNGDLTKEDIEKLPEHQRNFFNDNFYIIMKDAQQEWKGHKQLMDDLGEDKSGWTNCSLCNTPNRYVYYIVNQLNGIELNVGSECIRDFDDIIRTYGISRSKLIRDAQTRRKVLELNNQIPGIVKILEDWNIILDSYPIVIPTIIEKPLIDLGLKINTSYDHYLHDNLKTDDIVREINILINERKRVIKDIESYVEKNRNYRYIVTKSIERWVNNQGSKEAIRYIQEDGRIKLRSAHRITETSFMNIVTEDFRAIFKKHGISINKAKGNNSDGYMLKCNPRQDIELFCNHRDLLITYGEHIFEEKPESIISVKEILKISKIVDEDSCFSGVSMIAYLIKNEYKSIFEMDYKYNTVTILDKLKRQYLELQLISFVNSFRELIYGIKSQTVNDIMQVINHSNNKWLSKDNYESIIDNRYKDKDERKAFREQRDAFRY